MSSEERLGAVSVSDEVITACVADIVAGVDGVTALYSGITGNLTKNILGKEVPATKGVKIYRKGKKVMIDLYIIVEYEVRIPQLAWEIQTRVRQEVLSMTGITLDGVNVYVQGVNTENINKRDN